MVLGYYVAATFDPNPASPAAPRPVMPVAPIAENAAPIPEAAPSPTPEASVPQPPAADTGLTMPAEEAPIDTARRLANDFMISVDQKSKNETYEKALSAYDKLVEAEPDNIEALLGRGELKDMWVPQSGRMDYETVRDKLTPKLDQSSDNVALLRQRARAYKGLRQIDLAKTDLEAAIAADPNDAALKAEMQRLIDDKPFGL